MRPTVERGPVDVCRPTGETFASCLACLADARGRVILCELHRAAPGLRAALAAIVRETSGDGPGLASARGLLIVTSCGVAGCTHVVGHAGAHHVEVWR